MDMPLFREKMSDNKKKAMIVGTYHLFLNDYGKSLLDPVLDRMKDFVQHAPTEVRFEVAVDHPGIDPNITDSYLHRELRKVTESSSALDLYPEKLIGSLQKVMGKVVKLTAKAGELVGATQLALQTAQTGLYTNDVLVDILNSIAHQDFNEIDKTLQSFKKLPLILEKATMALGKDRDLSVVPKKLIDEYDALVEEVNRVIIRRDRTWVFPTEDRVLICVGYEHIKFVKDVYRKKGYTILT
jgi:hypothetical protein